MDHFSMFDESRTGGRGATKALSVVLPIVLFALLMFASPAKADYTPVITDVINYSSAMSLSIVRVQPLLKRNLT